MTDILLRYSFALSAKFGFICEKNAILSVTILWLRSLPLWLRTIVHTAVIFKLMHYRAGSRGGNHRRAITKVYLDLLSRRDISISQSPLLNMYIATVVQHSMHCHQKSLQTKTDTRQSPRENHYNTPRIRLLMTFLIFLTDTTGKSR